MNGQLQLVLLIAAVSAAAGAPGACTRDLDCSLNGVCSNNRVCECDAPWKGPSCGILGYKTTPASGKSLYTDSDTLNTWNGAILRDGDGMYHLYNPLYPAGALGGTTTLMHGTATEVAGPYNFTAYPDITIPLLGAFDGPKSVVYTELEGGANKTKYSLWLGGHVYLSDSAAGPFNKLANFSYPGHNPAPVWQRGAFYTVVSMAAGISTTPKLVPGAVWTHHADIDQSDVPKNWLPEDPDMWVDARGNWHIVNHAYNNYEYRDCASSVLSSHFFSTDGKAWHFLPQGVQPYSHTVQYDDGTSHMFVTMERPTMLFDDHGQLTHIHLAADLVSGDAGCGNRTAHAHFGHTPCDNCKYEDHGSTTIIALAA